MRWCLDLVQENATSTLCWTIHKPKRGWYIRIRAPSFPPGAFIALAPVPSTSPFHAEAALSFASRTNLPRRSLPSTTKSSMETIRSGSDATVVHAYPPTPPVPVVNVQPPSPRSVHQRLDELSPANRPRRPPTTVTQFIFTPHSTPHVPHPEPASFFVRALSAFRNSKPSHSSSFTLCPLPEPPASAVMSESDSASPHAQRHPTIQPTAPAPLLTFHDRTPIFTVRSTTGLLEIDGAMERELGVDRSFWIAVSLAYMEFLGEREVCADPCSRQLLCSC